MSSDALPYEIRGLISVPDRTDLHAALMKAYAEEYGSKGAPDVDFVENLGRGTTEQQMEWLLVVLTRRFRQMVSDFAPGLGMTLSAAQVGAGTQRGGEPGPDATA